MRKTTGAVLLIALTLLIVSTSHTQQVPFLSELFGRGGQVYKLYRAQQQKGVNLNGFDALRKRAEDAFRRGSLPLLLESLGEAQASLEGKAWDEKQRFMSSLTIETDREVIEPNQELQVSLVRMYPSAPEKAFGSIPTVNFDIIGVSAGGDPKGPSAGRPVAIGQRLAIGDVATLAARKLFLPNGRYEVVATIEAEGRRVGDVRKSVFAIGDFTVQIAALRRRLSAIKGSTDPKVKAVAHLVTTPEFQLQRLAPLNTNKGEDEIDAIAELDRIDSSITSLERGEDPFESQRGEIERAYTARDGKLVPYRIYIPRSYDGKTARPLVVMLHGVLGDERYYFSEMFDASTIRGEAERRGFILAGTNGRGRFGNYGGPSQEDTAEVVKAMSRDYKIDDKRVFLTGHSMGGSGTWIVASSHPELFAAIAPVSGSSPVQGEALRSLFEKLKSVPALVVAGGRDGLVPAERSREAVAMAQKAGLQVTYLEVPEADHISIVGASFPAILDFFEKVGKDRSQKSEARSQESEVRSPGRGEIQ